MNLKKHYDYIIIGAGSSGCVLANRLSANPDVSVLLVEAGGRDSSPFIHMPAAIPRVKDNPSLDWRYQTVPQPSLNNRRIPVPRGKVLGGSSSINAMIYIRGQKEDYDHWHNLGNKGWSFKDVLPYFIKSEQNHGVHLDKGFHGTDGPLHVSDLSYSHVLSDTLVEAGIDIGLRHNRDFNGKRQDGVGRFQVTQFRNRRCSASTAYLAPVLARENLEIITNSIVTKILLNGNKAESIELTTRGKKKIVHAKQEIIVSCGAIDSPKLLMLSGIGPGLELARHDIDVKHELPGVGQNLQDHLNLSMTARTKDPISLAGVTRGMKSVRVGLEYFLFKTGPGTSNGAEAGGFVTSSKSSGSPDIQLHFLPLVLGANASDVGIHGITVHSCNLRPTDRGTIRLSSANPFDAPLIDNRFLQTDGNMRIMREGLELSREIMAAKPVRDLLAEELEPGASVQSQDGLDQFIRNHTETQYHPVGTCKMGADDYAVVDPELRVRGLDGLRVVDASIMPELISGNTNAPCMMIAEKAADMMLGT